MSRQPFDRTAKASALVDYVGGVEPPHSYVHDTSSSVVHHGDYLNLRNDQALCGLTLEQPAVLDPAGRPVAVCPDCEAKLAEYHVKWWRERAESATTELDELRVEYRELAETVDKQRHHIAGSKHPEAVSDDPSGEKPDGRREADAEPTSLLDQVRKEILELGRRFDETIPYWALKNSIDAFNDKLTSDDRVLLAQEIGADGSLIRWCTKEIDGLGWQITNNPVHGDAEDMMEAWTHDLYQAPKKTKRRLGRFGSRDAS